MTSPYDGVQWVGMDLHRRRSVLVRMGSDGRQLGKSVRFNNDPVRLKREIAKAGPRAKVVLEATLGWYRAADVLTEAGAEVHLAHPLGVKAFAYRRVKNDERDAVGLADLLRMGRLPEAWLAPPEPRELRELVRGRHKLVKLAAGDGMHDASARRVAEGRDERQVGREAGGMSGGVVPVPRPAAVGRRDDAGGLVVADRLRGQAMATSQVHGPHVTSD